MRRLIIRLLWKLVDVDTNYEEIDDKRINIWLDAQHSTQGFREWWRKRDLAILKSLGGAVDHDNYLIHVGQRLEHLRILQEANEAHKLMDRIRALKEREAKKKKKEEESTTNNEDSNP